MNKTCPLSKKIRSFHNINICKHDLCYIGTNDENLSRKERILCSYKKHNNLDKNCHIGVSGYYNFDIIIFRKSDRCIIFDNNDQQIKFMKQTLNNINISPNRSEFIVNMINYLNMKKQEHSILMGETDNKTFKNFKIKGLSFMHNISYDESYKNLETQYDKTDNDVALTELIYELNRKGSWLSSEESYNYIRYLSLNDRISIFCEDILSINVFKRINNILQNNSIRIDTLYVTNVEGWVDEKDKDKYNQSLKYLSTPETLIINFDSVIVNNNIIS
jgi:hypothetical protein